MKLLSEIQSRILELLKTNTVLSIDDLTTELNMTKTAVRRQLLAMEKRELLEREYQHLERGRPALRFRLTSGAERLFPSKEAEILSELITFINRSGHEELLEKFFEDYWQKRLDSILAEIKKKGRDSFENRLELLKDVLARDGFMPSSRFESRGKELVLRECHCPLEAAVGVSRLPCKLEQRLISKVLNAPITSLEIRPDNNNLCEFRLPVSKIASQTNKKRRKSGQTKKQ